MTKLPTSFRLSETAQQLIEALSKDMGSSRTQVIETAIRDLAKRRKVEISTKEAKRNEQ
jgi:predicted transcriptional regulator